MSEIRVTSVVGENGGDRVGLTTGLTVGPLTGTTGIGVTISHQGHAQFAGVCTATSFVGNGAGLTSLASPYTEYLSAQSLSGGNTYTATISNNPKIIEVSLYKVRMVGSGNVTMFRVSTSAGEVTSGYHDISYAVKAGVTNVSNAVRGSGQAQGCLVNYDFTNSDNLISGEAKFTRVAAGLYTWQALYDHRFDPSRSGGDANDQYLLNSKGHIADFSSSGSGNITAFRIFTSGGGNFTGGTVTVRGIL